MGMTGECNVFISSTILSIDVVSIIITFIHIILLKTTPGSSRPNHFWILISLPLAGILISLSLTLNTSCLIHDIQLSANHVIGSAFLLTVRESATQSRYLLLLVASLDRFYAVCRPFKYSTSIVINNLGKTSLVAFLVSLVMPVAKLFVMSESLCLSGESGPGFLNGSDLHKLLITVINILLIILLAVVTAILLENVGWEIKNMKRKAAGTEDQEMKTTSKYILGTCIMFYSTVVPHFLFMIVAVVLKEQLNAKIFEPLVSIFWVLQSLYGIGNVLFYAYLHPSYVKRCKSFVKHRRTLVRVFPKV